MAQVFGPATSTITAAVAAVAGLVIAGAGTAANATTTPVPHTIAGSAVPFTSTAHSTGTVAGATRLTIQLGHHPGQGSRHRPDVPLLGLLRAAHRHHRLPEGRHELPDRGLRLLRRAAQVRLRR